MEGRRLHVHHIHLRTTENRADAEYRAVKQILRWFRQKQFTGFTYTENIIDYGTLNFTVKDYASYAYVAGMILANPRNKHIKTLIHPRHLEAFNLRRGQSFEGAAERSNQVLTGIPKLISRRDVQLEFPIGDMTKQEIIDACPPDLLRLAWYCRRPRRGGSVFTPCHACHTCKQVDAAGGTGRGRESRVRSAPTRTRVGTTRSASRVSTRVPGRASQSSRRRS